ncbi:hypothetical protein E1176_15560 [Fulvivirga sp. RKSG066]|uniref:hypothetical protein n=1 Tax=Fulvivirga aurantia TaxID=2529383 RepID=UPI0012BD7677|nr:hypothetical protein [Fulvivirga aurantia]MTI22449.1 hypothetical protein [Fulvivirga aurantia]
MSARLFLVFSLLSISFSFDLMGQEVSATADNSALADRFKSLDVSYLGTTQNCIPYDVYALKYHNTWVLTILEQETVATFVTRPPRSDEKVHTASTYFTEGVSYLVEIDSYFKKKKRKKTVNDLELYGFYKLNKKGKRAMRGMLLLELPDEKEVPDFFLFKFFHSLFSKAEKEVDDNRLKPNLEEKIKSTEEKINAQVDDIK